MKYLSIDIETTGLDPREDQILQIAMVADIDPAMPVEGLPFIDITVKHKRIWGDPFALHMNAKLLLNISQSIRTTPAAEVEDDLIDFLEKWMGTGSSKVVAAGKNFASFDLQFLKRHAPQLAARFHHRCIDPGTRFMRLGDEVPPSTDECIRRSGLSLPPVTHDALDDARTICHLVRSMGVV